MKIGKSVDKYLSSLFSAFSGKNMPKWKYSRCPFVDLTWLISVFRFACSQTTVFMKCLILMFSLRIKQRLH